MKNITVKNYSIPDGSGGNMNTKGLIKHCLSLAPQNGFTIEDVRNRLRIEEVVSRSIETISLEDSDAKNLHDIVMLSRWGTYHPDIIDFVDQIKTLIK
jgi:hypothetical protein